MILVAGSAARAAHRERSICIEYELLKRSESVTAKSTPPGRHRNARADLTGPVYDAKKPNLPQGDLDPEAASGARRGRLVTIWSTYGDYHVSRVKALAAYGFEVIPFAHCDDDSEYPFFLAKPDSLVVVNPGSADRINPVLSLWRTWRLLRVYRPDIVLTMGYERPESLAACLFARASRAQGAGRPVAILMLNNRSDDHPRSRLMERVKSIYMRAFDGFLASGSDCRDYLEQLGVPRTKIELGYNCVDNDAIAGSVAYHRATRKSANQTTAHFLCVARLVPKKNIPGVVRAYHSYLRSLPDSSSPIPLVLCGDGPERGAIEDLIQRLGLGNWVRLLGEVSGIEAVASQLADCLALVLASTSDETWGLVVNEAMAAGCPVLVSRQCGCARDLVEHGVNGFTFDGQDSDALAQHMLWVQTHPGLLEAMGAKSKEIVDRFTPARFAASASKLARSEVGSTLVRPQQESKPPPTNRMTSGIRLVTIWSTYGDYHVSRVKALAAYGFEVIPFAHCDDDSEYPFFRAKPDSLVVVNPGSADRINPVLSLWRTWRLLRLHRPDIVLTMGYERPESLAACLFARASRAHSANRPVVILMIENRADDHARSRLMERVKSVYMRVLDGFLASGSDARDYLEQLGVPRTKIELGYSCVDNERIAALVARHRATRKSANQTTAHFLCVARLVPKKNIPGVVRAYHSYLRSLPDSSSPIPLVLCGDGPERGAIEDLIQRLGLGNWVRLLGEVNGIEAVASQLADCEALVLASIVDETWGLVVNEAMAAGCPVLVSRQCGCARDLVEQGVNGFTFDGQDSDALARHMLWIQTHPGLLEAMGAKSKEIVDRFTPARFAASASKLARSAEASATRKFPIV